MLSRNKTLPRKFVVDTKSVKTNKRNNNSKLLNAVTVTKQENTIHSRLERREECGLIYGVFIHSETVL